MISIPQVVLNETLREIHDKISLPDDILLLILRGILCETRDIRRLCFTTSGLYNILFPFYCSSLKMELKNSVFTSKPFFPSEIKNRTRKNEEECYPPLHHINFFLGDNVIGYAKWHQKEVTGNKFSYWTCYCVVPMDIIHFYDTKYENFVIDRSLITEDESIKFRKLNKIQEIIREISYSNIDDKIIGWDHNFVLNQTNYRNYSVLQTEFWDVWSIIYAQPLPCLEK